MQKLEKTDIQLGYIPLLDCVALLWAKHQGYFAEQGLNVTLTQEPSWASLRDRLAFGFLDAAHCLSAMLPAAATGHDHLGIPLQSAAVLSTTRAFISLSQKLCFDLQITAQDSPAQSAQKAAAAIQHGMKIKLAHVFTQSLHHYCLREWIALASPDLAKSMKLAALPPPYMVEAVEAHLIDGFCVGEPWNIQSEILGHSQIIAESRQIIPEIADKVLASTEEWAARYPNTLKALQTAIQKAQHDISDMASSAALWRMLEDCGIIRFKCSAHVHTEKFHKLEDIIRSFGAQSEPKAADFAWIIRQQIKWDGLEADETEIAAIAAKCIASNSAAVSI